MTMLSFRVSEERASEVVEWARRLGVDRSDLLREALRRYIVRLRSEADAETWQKIPPTADETSFAEVAEWGPAEDWSDWQDAAR